MTVYQEHLFSNADDKAFLALPSNVRARCLRLRSIYTEALNFPFRKDASLIATHKKKFYPISTTQAYEDLRIAKCILGDVHQTSKEYHRWRFIQMIEDTYNAAVAAGDNAARVKAADTYGKYTRLNVDDEMVMDWSRIPNQPFTITFDPSQLGLKPIPNIRKYIDDTFNEFSKGDIIDVDYEIVDVNVDPFKRSEQDGGAEITD